MQLDDYKNLETTDRGYDLSYDQGLYQKTTIRKQQNNSKKQKRK